MSLWLQSLFAKGHHKRLKKNKSINRVVHICRFFGQTKISSNIFILFILNSRHQGVEYIWGVAYLWHIASCRGKFTFIRLRLYRSVELKLHRTNQYPLHENVCSACVVTHVHNICVRHPHARRMGWGHRYATNKQIFSLYSFKPNLDCNYAFTNGFSTNQNSDWF